MKNSLSSLMIFCIFIIVRKPRKVTEPSETQNKNIVTLEDGVPSFLSILPHEILTRIQILY